MDGAESLVAAHANTQQQQLVSLKVMRLSRPRLSLPSSPSLDPLDPLSSSIQHSFSVDPLASLPIGEFLIAPVQFENIYLGETFTFLVHCINESDGRVGDVAVKVELQTASQRIALGTGITGVALEPQATTSEVLTHEVKEAGQHIIVCSVTYSTPSGESMFMRKFFKFPVAKPIDVKTKLYNAVDNASCDGFLEAQIENTSAYGMLMERVTMEPSESYAISPIGKMKEAVMLQPKEVLQVLFGFVSKNSVTAREITTIGKLDMEWRSRMGERGRLQTSALERIAPGYGDVRLKVESIPSSVKAREQFSVQCSLYNCCDQSLDLRLLLDPSLQPSLVFCCPSGVSLGQIPPKGHTTFTLHLLAVTFGFQSISGIRAESPFTNRTYEFDDVAQVYVI